jgi:peptidoglycan-N-acetylglucosamine deacetylase
MPLRFLFTVTALASILNAALSGQTAIQSVKTAQPVVALTLDDGPHPVQTPLLLELLAREGIRVTFFEIGRHVADHPELARAILAAGHEIGNHSMTHPRLGEMTDLAAVRAELVDTQAIIHEATGFTPVIFRAPYLSHGPALWSALAELGLPSIGASHDSKDWNTSVSMEEVIERSAKAGPGDIVLLHTFPAKTAEAMPEIIRQLRAKGLRFVTVSELLALSTPASE